MAEAGLSGTLRIKDSLETFKSVLKTPLLAEIPVILFLNKLDLFNEKASRVDLKTVFPDYTGGLNSKKAFEFIRNEYSKRCDRPDLVIHPCIATDTQNFRKVWEAVNKAVISINIRNSGLM